MGIFKLTGKNEKVKLRYFFRSGRENIESGTDEGSTPWAESIFNINDDLIKHDLSSENRVFAIGFGAVV